MLNTGEKEAFQKRNLCVANKEGFSIQDSQSGIVVSYKLLLRSIVPYHCK